ncbi:hypothetical protein JY651_15870 [Pyxidicoccus parkwayensis]|uniref:Uncharacterized protein n=1 Tax=Pyxidicoccus parkwayensis TaxID=2813578 RepID=A0ABX7P795_9BACT|nr:hypothetical protein [Pyxidicoccus parkwaysis]QSQ26316.1 hypothetical protein JY651_15870 [Pyxidicoccus parkwaysis]
MKRKLLVASVFLFGLGLGVASASALEPGPSGITPEQKACIMECEANGGEFRACFDCCVLGRCGEA